MADLLASYRGLDHTSSRSTLSHLLNSVVNASPTVWVGDTRPKLIQLLLDDVALAGSRKGRFISRDVHQALLAIKTLGRHPDGSAVIVAQSNLQILSSVIAAKKDPDASNTALRCVANALLLQDSGRDAWLALGGGEKALFTLQGDATMEQVFLSSRILFLVTLKPTPFLRKAVEDLGLIDALAKRLASSLAAVVANGPFGKDAHVDILKVTFNVMTQYSRMAETLPGKSTEGKHLGELWDDRFENIVNPLIRSLHLLPPTSSPPLQAPLTHVLHALINVPITAKWFSSALPPRTALAQTSELIVIDTVRRLFDLFSLILEHYIAYNPDDAAVRAKCREEGVVLDELVVPIPIILARLAKGDVSARSRLRDWILPQDLDRSKALEKRYDTLGRCLRLMSSIHHPHLKETVGDLMFAVCDEDASTLTTQIGYGNAAGFLFNKGMMAPPGEAYDANGVLLNPITGTNVQPRPADVEMSQEEKEREAERLFVLFDRLERSGMGVNPVRQAQQEGKFENVS